METIETYSKQNAVKVVALAVNFSERISDENIDSLIKQLHDNKFFSNEFSNIQNQEEISMTISPDGIQQQTQRIAGVLYNKFDENGSPTWSLTINKDFILITCRDYTRWEYVSMQSYNYFDEVFQLIPKKLSQITLEYLDEFKILDIKTDWKQVLFKTECGYITSNIYQYDDFWHINQGSFTQLDPLGQKLLDNININYFADEQDQLKHKVHIRTQHKLRYIPDEEYCEKTKENFDSIHVHSKKIFEQIVHDTILNQFDRGEKL